MIVDKRLDFGYRAQPTFKGGFPDLTPLQEVARTVSLLDRPLAVRGE